MPLTCPLQWLFHLLKRAGINMPYINTDKKAAKIIRNVSLSIGGIYDRLYLFVNQAFAPFFFPIAMAFKASPAIFTILSGIFWGKFVPPFAMSFSFISRTISNAAKGKSFLVSMLFLGQYFFNIPSKLYSAINGLVRYAELVSPFHSRLAFSIKFYKMVISSITLLLRSCSPSAIFRAIISIRVNSINTHVGFWMPHISKEIFKARPSFAYFNSAPSIIFVCFAFWIVTSLPNTKPNTLYSSAVKAVSVYSFNHSKNLSLSHNGIEWRRSQS